MSSPPRRGHPDVFNEAQNAALRSALKTVQASKSMSQAALGALLGTGQQTASRLLNDDRAGFSYATATRLVQHLRFAGVDSFFRAKGVALARVKEEPEPLEAPASKAS